MSSLNVPQYLDYFGEVSELVSALLSNVQTHNMKYYSSRYEDNNNVSFGSSTTHRLYDLIKKLKSVIEAASNDCEIKYSNNDLSILKVEKLPYNATDFSTPIVEKIPEIPNIRYISMSKVKNHSKSITSPYIDECVTNRVGVLNVKSFIETIGHHEDSPTISMCSRSLRTHNIMIPPPMKVKIGQEIVVTVTFVGSPRHFNGNFVSTIYLKDQTNFPFQTLEDLSEEMNKSDVIASYQPLCSETPLYTGTLIIAPYDGNYYRAQIIDTPVDGMVQVYFFDFGNYSTVATTVLKEFSNEFQKFVLFPVQGVKCVVANHISPKSNQNVVQEIQSQISKIIFNKSVCCKVVGVHIDTVKVIATVDNKDLALYLQEFGYGEAEN